MEHTANRTQRRKNARDHAKAAIKQNIQLRQAYHNLAEHAKSVAKMVDERDAEIVQLKTILREMLLEVGKLDCQTPDAPGMPCGKCIICEAKQAVQSIKEEENVATETDQEPA